MKVYFTASSKRDSQTYNQIINILTKLGWKLLIEENLDKKIEEDNFEVEKEARKDAKKVKNFIGIADIVIAEISNSDIDLGYKITLALGLEKPMILLYKEGDSPYILQGLYNEKLQICPYGKDDLKEVLEYALKEAREKMDVRFNFFISSKIIVYLNWISKNKKIPRAVFLRQLIENRMKNDKEYKKHKED